MVTTKGGDQLQATLNSIIVKMGKGIMVVRCGFFEDAEYPDGTKVAMVAAIQNFGAPKVKIPPRPFFSNFVAQGEKVWPEISANLLKANNYDIELTLAQLGHEMEGELHQSIQQTNSPPLRPATIKRKGFDKSLIASGRMNRSIISKVETP